MKTVLIGLNGLPRSGKDTAASVIHKWGQNRSLRVHDRAFADYGRISMMRSLGLATNLNDAKVLFDGLKENGYIEIVIPDHSIMMSIDGRTAAKWYMTEGHRDVFGDNFWVDLILPIEVDWRPYWADSNDDIDIAIVTDCRFVNEAKRIKELGGVIWEIDRGLAGDGPPSEQPLPRYLVDLTIKNDSTLEAFEVAVNSEMTAEFHMNFLVERPDPLS